MIRHVLRASVLFALTASANAADLYVPGPGGYKDAYVWDWAGLYAGANVGAAFGDLKVTDLNGYATAATPGTKTSVTSDGVFAGGSLGYNFQRGSVVFGVEWDMGVMNLTHDKPLAGDTAGTRVGINQNVYGDVTGRLGYAWGPALLYMKGGFAFYEGQNRFSTATGSLSYAGKTDPFTGWTIGTGVEYKLSPSWALKWEYEYFDFGTENFAFLNAAGTPFRFKDDLTVNTVKFGVNYYVGNAIAPLK